MSGALRPQYVANLTGLATFVMAAADDATAGGVLPVTERLVALREAVLPLLHQVRTQSTAREGDQQVVDAVIEVMGSAWRPSAYWREQLAAKGRHDLASW